MTTVLYGILAETCIALFDYISTEPGDLTFRAGDVITVEQSDGEWWKGSMNGRSGVFPANYVRLQMADSNVSTCGAK